jgi:hypothetical protein
MTHRSPAASCQVRRLLSRSAAGLALVGVLAGPGVAAAQSAKSVAAARQAFKDGDEAEARGDLLIALDKFKEAAALKDTAQLHVRIGAVQEKLGRLVDALASYERGLARASAIPSVAKIAREQIDSLRARVPKVTVLVSSPPADLVVTIDGAPFSPSAFGTPVPIDPGTHRLHAQAPGFLARDQTFTAAERSAPRIELSLLPGGDRPASTAARDAAPSRLPGALLAAGGGAVLVAGAAMLGASYAKDGTVNSQCGGSARTGCPASLKPEITSEISTINALRGGSIPLLLAGAAGVATGAFFLARAPAGPAAPPTVGAWVVPGSAGVVLSGRF